MTRAEFLDELRETLSGNMNESEIQNHLTYYQLYIDDEMKKGRTEEEVLEELGSPFAIAKTLMMPFEKEVEPEIREEQVEQNSSKKIITIVIIIALGVFFLSLLFGILAFVIRYAVPITAIGLIIYFLEKR